MKKVFRTLMFLHLICLFFSPTPGGAIPLSEFIQRFETLKKRSQALEKDAHKLDSVTEQLVQQMGTVSQVVTSAGRVDVNLSWIDSIARDIQDETTDTRRHLYWKSLLDTLEGLKNELSHPSTGSGGRPTSEILAALRDSRKEVRSLRQCLVTGAGGEGDFPQAALDQFVELPPDGEITAIRSDSGSFAGYGTRNLDSVSSGRSSSPGSSGSSSSPGTPVSFGSSAGGPQGHQPGTQAIPKPAFTNPQPAPPPPPPPKPPPLPPPKPTGSAEYLNWIIGTLVIIVVLAVAFLIYRAWARSRALTTHKPLVLGTSEVEEELRRRKNVDLYQQALNEAGKGNYEMGVRLMALAILLLIDQRGRLNFDKTRTNGEYRLRIQEEQPTLGRVIDNPLRVFDRLYYGSTPASEADFQEFRSVFEKLERNLT